MYPVVGTAGCPKTHGKMIGHVLTCEPDKILRIALLDCAET